MDLGSLGYAVFGTAALDEWIRYGTEFLGFQLAEKTRQSALFRMDEAARGRVLIDATMPANYRCFGWQVHTDAAMNRLVARLDAAEVSWTKSGSSLGDIRGVKELIRFQDPMGNWHEAFREFQSTNEPFQPGRSISGFRTGALGLGHAVLWTRSVERNLPFFRDVMGMAVSDYMTEPFHAYFMHVNGRHHSLALIESDHDGMHHMMVELLSIDDVGQGYDLALRDPDRVAQTLGRHSNDLVLSFYTRSPSGFLVEYGWGGRQIDPATWVTRECKEGPSLWGHERLWLPPEARKKALDMRLAAAASGIRAPVQVLPGNFEIMEAVSGED